MSYKCDHMRLSESQDRRRKLSEEDKATIRRLYASGAGSYQALADRFHVSKSTINIICNPARAAAVQARIKEHWRDYADRKALTDAARNLRHYKHELYLKGELPDQKEDRP